MLRHVAQRPSESKGRHIFPFPALVKPFICCFHTFRQNEPLPYSRPYANTPYCNFSPFSCSTVHFTDLTTASSSGTSGLYPNRFFALEMS